MADNIKTIKSFDDFCIALRFVGFSMGGGNDEGIFSLSKFYSSDLKGFSGEIDVDPWEWRIRVLQECDDIAYSKLFFNKTGFITKEWYKYFYVLRRKYRSIYDAYNDGTVNKYSKKIYEIIENNGRVAFHNIKYLCGFDKSENGKIEKAITELQMKMYITMCGNEKKRSLKGEEYGWPSAVFCKCEDIFEKQYFENAFEIPKEEAFEKIKTQILRLNPKADNKNINKFIYKAL